LGGISERRQRKRGRERDGGRGNRANTGQCRNPHTMKPRGIPRRWGHVRGIGYKTGDRHPDSPEHDSRGRFDSEKGMAKDGVRGRGKVHEMVPYPDRAFDEDSGERVR